MPLLHLAPSGWRDIAGRDPNMSSWDMAEWDMAEWDGGTHSYAPRPRGRLRPCYRMLLLFYCGMWVKERF